MTHKETAPHNLAFVEELKIKFPSLFSLLDWLYLAHLSAHRKMLSTVKEVILSRVSEQPEAISHASSLFFSTWKVLPDFSALNLALDDNKTNYFVLVLEWKSCRFIPCYLSIKDISQ
jgi:hypothetical protein